MSYIGELSGDKEIIDSNRAIIIYGAGGYGEKIYRNLAIYDKQKNIKAFVDKDSSKQGKKLHNIPIIGVERAIEEYRETIICIGGGNSRKCKGIRKNSGNEKHPPDRV